jgi:hypothetical protein
MSYDIQMNNQADIKALVSNIPDPPFGIYVQAIIGTPSGNVYILTNTGNWINVSIATLMI